MDFVPSVKNLFISLRIIYFTWHGVFHQASYDVVIYCLEVDPDSSLIQRHYLLIHRDLILTDLRLLC